MDIRHLTYFLEVARQKSFTSAAEKLHITQPTISRMIKNIEDELNVTLFDRSNKQIKLTDAGEALFRQAQNIVSSFDNLSSEIDAVTKVQRGHIRIGLPPMIGANFFPSIIGNFNRIYPLISLELFEFGAKKIESAVESGDLDIGVSLLPVNSELFETFPFAKEELRVLVHPTHPLATKKEARLIDLRNDSFIYFCEDFALYNRIREECIRVGFNPKVIYESSQWDFIGEMVGANLGIALLPETICKKFAPEKAKSLVLTKPTILWHLAMIWRKDRYLSFAARKWLEFVQSVLKPAQ